jgi:hypothetical protein
LSESFTKRFADLLTLKRGGGYYCWKAEILLQQLDMADEGDIIIYSDAGCTLQK